MKPLISICIPAYNQVDNIKQLLKSIQAQTFRDFEVIVSDDSRGSEVENVVKLEDWGFEISYFRNNVAKGSPGNWNHAISKARGSWIKLMHHDDWFEYPNSLEQFVNAINNQPNEKFFFCGTWIFDTQKKNKYIYKPSKLRFEFISEKPAELFHANVIGAPTTTLIHTDIQELYDENLIWLVDIEYYSRLICKYGVAKISEALIATSAEQPDQLTSSLKDNKQVELKEFFYCYNKLSRIFNATNQSILRQRILFLLQHYKVETINEIRNSGFKGKIPFFVQTYCFLSIINNTLARKILGKWLQFQLS